MMTPRPKKDFVDQLIKQGEQNLLTAKKQFADSKVAVKKQSLLHSMADEIVSLLEKKEEAYGSAFDKVGEFVKLLYPEGVQPHQYTDMLFCVRMFDKMMRVANNKKAFNEEPYKDMTGYSFLGWRKEKRTYNENCDEPYSADELKPVPNDFFRHLNEDKDLG